MWFGIHLVRRNQILAEDLVAGLEQVLKSRVPIGRLAMETGRLSMKQVFEILAVQSETDEFFGQIAMRLGYLTESQLSELLATQVSREKPIGEALVELGAITRPQMEAELTVFHRQRRGASQRQDAEAEAGMPSLA